MISEALMKTEDESIFSFDLKISSIEDNENGTSTVNFELSKDFIEWFKKDQGLSRFSHKRFNSFMSNLMIEAASKSK